MTKIFQNNITLVLIILTYQFTFGQKKDDNIGTEVVNVVKPYTPTISDAFKVKEIPSLEDADNSRKEDIRYYFFSFPVASTFVPSKGRAAKVDKTEAEKLYKNFANLGLGNYTLLNAELFVTENISDHEYIGGMFKHFSSQGRIKDVELNNDFATTSLDLTYGNQFQNLTWISDIGYHNQIYNWYGIPNNFSQSTIDRINPKHAFNNFYFGTSLSYRDSFFKEASFKAEALISTAQPWLCGHALASAIAIQPLPQPRSAQGVRPGSPSSLATHKANSTNNSVSCRGIRTVLSTCSSKSRQGQRPTKYCKGTCLLMCSSHKPASNCNG